MGADVVMIPGPAVAALVACIVGSYLICGIPFGLILGRIMGHDRYRVFFPSLYELEARGFAFSSDIPGMMAMRMAKDDSAGHLSAGKAV